MSFSLAAAERTLPGQTLLEKYDFVRSVGFQGIELAAEGNGVFASRADELAQAREQGVQMPSAVVAMDHFIGDFDPDRRRSAIDEIKKILSTLAIAGSRGLVSPHAYGLFSKRLPPFEAPRSDEESHRLLVDALRELGDHAADCGTVVYLEPLNRYEDFVINTLAQAVAVVEEVDSPGVEVIADTYHMSIEEARIGDSIRAAGKLIGHVQLGDSNRLEPGAGHYDWPETLQALRDIDFHGWLAMECRLSGTVQDVLPRVAKMLNG
jgi:sugar phosphate isomerase/epimerase